MTTDEGRFIGVYGPYSITEQDRREVQLYRASLLLAGVSLLGGLVHWWALGSRWAWVWTLPLAGALGLALHWIHIYLRPLHRMLQLFWLLGCIGWIGLNLQVGVEASLTTLAANPLWIFAIGPLFAALAGIGFKEFFCFRRPEAIGLTLLLPVSLLGRLLGLIGPSTSFALIALSAALLVLLSLRKFGMEAAADVGDKSVFAYLDGQLPAPPS